jgi:hypothetical protein
VHRLDPILECDILGRPGSHHVGHEAAAGMRFGWPRGRPPDLTGAPVVAGLVENLGGDRGELDGSTDRRRDEHRQPGQAHLVGRTEGNDSKSRLSAPSAVRRGSRLRPPNPDISKLWGASPKPASAPIASVHSSIG